MQSISYRKIKKEDEGPNRVSGTTLNYPADLQENIVIVITT